MVIPPPTREPRIVKFLKPYVLKMNMSNKFSVSQQPLFAASASSQEVVLRSAMENTHDVEAAGKIGKILAERLLLKDIPAVSIFLKREQKYHGKVIKGCNRFIERSRCETNLIEKSSGNL